MKAGRSSPIASPTPWPANPHLPAAPRRRDRRRRLVSPAAADLEAPGIKPRAILEWFGWFSTHQEAEASSTQATNNASKSGGGSRG